MTQRTRSIQLDYSNDYYDSSQAHMFDPTVPLYTPHTHCAHYNLESTPFRHFVDDSGGHPEAAALKCSVFPNIQAPARL